MGQKGCQSTSIETRSRFSTRLQQHLSDFVVFSNYCRAEGCPTRFVFRIDTRTFNDQRPHYIGVSRIGGGHKGSLADRIRGIYLGPVS